MAYLAARIVLLGVSLALPSVAFQSQLFSAAGVEFPNDYGASKLQSHNGYENTAPELVAGLDLKSLSTADFTTLSHPSFPAYGIRIKRTLFCDPTVAAYTGYLDVDYDTKHLFFYFFESRSNPDKDDVLMWINGGPGCSSSLGLLMELGPCTMNDPNSLTNATIWNPYSWNSNANLFFLDQPVGVGFSYADYGERVQTTEEAAKDVQAFVTIFFETFKKFKGRPFHMSGESYGGRYLPVFASEVVDQNKRAKENGVSPINLKSVLIGNGITDFFTMKLSYYDIPCTTSSVVPFLDISTCVAMKQALPRCAKWMRDECLDRFDSIGCAGASLFCDEALSAPFRASGRNPYDVTKECKGPIAETLCYPIIAQIATYLNRPDIQELLGVHPVNYSGCSNVVGKDFNNHFDKFHPTQYYVAGLLERGIRVLIYVGTHDWICNHVGNLRWANALEWSGHDEFSSKSLVPWNVGGEVAGYTKSAKNFTYATVLAAGHMVPADKPVEALAMLQRWIAGKPLTEG